jgi:hypothetical protein
MVKTAELEARGRDPDCLRFGGMSLREGTRARVAWRRWRNLASEFALGQRIPR